MTENTEKKGVNTNKKAKKKSNKKIKRIVIALWAIFLLGIASIAVIFLLISTGKIGYMPDIRDLENPIDKYASQVYSSDGILLGTYSQAKNNRIYSDFSELPDVLVKALVATEDERFYNHSGVDAYALARVIGKTLFLQQSSGGGGSTITQQLAKQLYSPPVKNFKDRALQKPIEWVIAARLERYYTKEEIINLYLSKFDFLNNAVGIKSAAQVYFNKLPKDLKIEEAATLVGMCQNPSYYNPIRKDRIERTRIRRNVVLFQMHENGYLTRQEYDSLKLLPLVTDYRKADHKDGLAPYMREYLRLTMSAKKPDKSKYAGWQEEQYKTDSTNWENNPLYGWCNKNQKPDGSNYNLGTDGLRIYTTIDSRMQQYAEEAMTEHMSKTVQPAFDRQNKNRIKVPFSVEARPRYDDILNRLMKQTDRYKNMKKEGRSEAEILDSFKKPVEMKVFSWKGEIDTTMTPLDSIIYHISYLRSGFMAMDTHTGHVKAYVGGIDFKYFQYDMVNSGRRQIGSTVKPFLYSLSMEEGMTPCDEMLHVQQTLKTETGQEWTPRNSNQKRIGEMVTIKWGLQNSDNWVTAYLMGKTSPYSFARLLKSFGITGKIDPVVSMCLGSQDVSVSEMAGAYTAFANKGIRATPLYVTRIEDSRGNVISTFTSELHEVFGERTYMKMLDMLQAVIDGGTGYRARRMGVEGPLGGKTGTTQKNSDGWFVGFSPQISAACWVGGEDTGIHFDNMGDGQGAAVALPIFSIFLKKVYDDRTIKEYKPDAEFEKIPAYSNVCGRGADEATEEPSIGIDNMFN